MFTWPLQEAKAKFSEVVRLATIEGPQGVSIRGEERIVILSKTDYEVLCQKKMPFLTLMAHSPLKDIDLDLKRDLSPCRDIDL